MRRVRVLLSVHVLPLTVVCMWYTAAVYAHNNYYNKHIILSVGRHKIPLEMYVHIPHSNEYTCKDYRIRAIFAETKQRKEHLHCGKTENHLMHLSGLSQ